MKKTISCFLLAGLACIMLLFPLQGEEAKSLKCGWMLYIELQEPYKIYLNGNYKGITPQLITGLPAGEFRLRLEGAQNYHETKGIANPAETGLTIYKPVPGKYKGELQLTTSPPGAEVRIDDTLSGKTPLLLKDIEEGSHIVSFDYPGYRNEKHTIKVVRTERAKLETALVRLYNINFDPPLSDGLTVTCKNETEQLAFSSGKSCVLPAGVWQLTLKGEGIAPETREITVNGDLQLAFTPVLFNPKLVFTNLMPSCIVFVDSNDITSQLTNNQFLLSQGKHNVIVRKAPYLDFQSTIDVQEDKDTLVEIAYIKDPQIIKQNKQTAGWITAGAGAVLSIASLVFNLDDVSTAMSGGNYDSYALIKYSTLGTLGAGGAGIIVGLLLQL